MRSHIRRYPGVDLGVASKRLRSLWKTVVAPAAAASVAVGVAVCSTAAAASAVAVSGAAVWAPPWTRPTIAWVCCPVRIEVRSS